jgi:hypothetical protein
MEGGVSLLEPSVKYRYSSTRFITVTHQFRSEVPSLHNSPLMSPGILYIRYFGIIIPIRITLSFALLFISIKANVISASEGVEWSLQPGHHFLLATALVNIGLAVVSIALFLIRDEDKLSPRLRWTSAVCGLATRLFLFALVILTIVVTALAAQRSEFRINELVLTFIALGLLL